MTEEERKELMDYAEKYPKDYAEKANEANSIPNKTLKIINGVLVIVDVVSNIVEAKIRKLAEINSIYEQKATIVKVGVPEDEIKTWTIQETEATGYNNDNNSPTPFIDGLVAKRGIQKDELVSRILAKVEAYKVYMGDLTGTRQKYEDMINNSTTIEEVEAILWIERE